MFQLVLCTECACMRYTLSSARGWCLYTFWYLLVSARAIRTIPSSISISIRNDDYSFYLYTFECGLARPMTQSFGWRDNSEPLTRVACMFHVACTHFAPSDPDSHVAFELFMFCSFSIIYCHFIFLARGLSANVLEMSRLSVDIVHRASRIETSFIGLWSFRFWKRLEILNFGGKSDHRHHHDAITWMLGACVWARICPNTGKSTATAKASAQSAHTHAHAHHEFGSGSKNNFCPWMAGNLCTSSATGIPIHIYADTWGFVHSKPAGSSPIHFPNRIKFAYARIQAHRGPYLGKMFAYVRHARGELDLPIRPFGRYLCTRHKLPERRTTNKIKMNFKTQFLIDANQPKPLLLFARISHTEISII